MSKANWILLDKQSGSGNGTVNVSAGSNRTGRTPRASQLIFSAPNCEDVAVNVSQAGKPEFVQIAATAAVGKEGGSITIEGVSNSSKLEFSLGVAGDLAITLPAQFLANSVQTNNGVAIAGDPGANAEYPFSTTITGIPANATVDTLSKQLIVTDNAGHTSTCTIQQTAGDPTLNVSPLSIEIPWDASESRQVTVTSNTAWEVA